MLINLQIELLRGSSDFFGLNHYTTYLMSDMPMLKGWRVPSWDHDTGVLLEQNPLWPKPGADWLAVSNYDFLRKWTKVFWFKKNEIIL